MRSHAQIIADAGGPDGLQTTLKLESVHTVRSWRQRGRLPADMWKPIADAGIATLEELAAGAAERERRERAA